MFKIKNKIPYNTEMQYYKGIPISLILRNYGDRNAYRYNLNNTRQNVWIPKKHLNDDGTLKPGENIDYVFRKSQNILAYAGIWMPVIGIKRRTEVTEEIVLRYNSCKTSSSEPLV